MHHLMIETIARLVDEAPTSDEAKHLEACTECRAELEAMRADVAALANLPMIEPPPTGWSEIERQLLDEGLIRRRRRTSAWRLAAVRTAASLALFAVGAASGIAWTRADGPTGTEPGLRTTAGTPTLIAAPEPDSPEETVLLYRQAEALYLDMLTRVVELEEPRASADPVARLAALESIAAITRSALDQAPTDPVLNGYHLTALAQKEATLRQITGSKAGRWF